jgi:hypothetical protein
MRRFGHSVSISAVYQTSRPLRSQRVGPLPCQRNRFLAVCWLIVLAPRMPRTGRPRISARAWTRSLWARALAIASKSKPWWFGKFWSSAATSASGSERDIRSRLRQSWAMR